MSSFSMIMTQNILLILSRIGPTSKGLNWPLFSPDMNPIEHLCDDVERRMKKYQPKNEGQLRRIVQIE